jgi:tetratricopeptide (TPR) repeat protein
LPDEAAARQWFTAEHYTLLATHVTATEQGWHNQIWQMAWTLDTFYAWRGHTQDGVELWRAGLAATEHIGDPAIRSLAHRRFGHACAHAELHAEALLHLQQSLIQAEQTTNLYDQAEAHRFLALTWAMQRHNRQALEHATQALRLYRTIHLPLMEGATLDLMGLCQARLGHHEQARVHCEAALALARRHHNPTEEASALQNLGEVAHRAGEYSKALDFHHQALTLQHQQGNSHGEAETLGHLGQSHQALGQHDQARAAWRQALVIYRTLNRATDADEVRQQLKTLDDERSNAHL